VTAAVVVAWCVIFTIIVTLASPLDHYTPWQVDQWLRALSHHNVKHVAFMGYRDAGRTKRQYDTWIRHLNHTLPTDEHNYFVISTGLSTSSHRITGLDIELVFRDSATVDSLEQQEHANDAMIIGFGSVSHANRCLIKFTYGAYTCMSCPSLQTASNTTLDNEAGQVLSDLRRYLDHSPGTKAVALMSNGGTHDSSARLTVVDLWPILSTHSSAAISDLANDVAFSTLFLR
jgi:hypothetical protein